MSGVKVRRVKFRLFLQMRACRDLEREVRKWTKLLPGTSQENILAMFIPLRRWNDQMLGSNLWRILKTGKQVHVLRSPRKSESTTPPRERKRSQDNKTHTVAHDNASSSTGASWRPTRLVVMVPVKVAQETVMQDLVWRNPWPLLRAIPLTIDQAMETTSTPIEIRNVLDHIQ